MAANNNKPHTRGPQKGKTAANALVTAVAVVIVLVLMNVVLIRVPKRIDLTEDGVYSLSKYSKDLVSTDFSTASFARSPCSNFA